MLNPSEFSDDISIKSDDTDLLLTQSHNYDVKDDLELDLISYEYEEDLWKFNGIDSNNLQDYTLTAANTKEELPYIHKQEPLADKDFADLEHFNSTNSFKTDKSYQNFDNKEAVDVKKSFVTKELHSTETSFHKSPTKKVNFADEDELSPSRFSRLNKKTSPIAYLSSLRDSVSYDKDEIDQKVREGQEILKRLRLGSQTSNSFGEIYPKSTNHLSNILDSCHYATPTDVTSNSASTNDTNMTVTTSSDPRSPYKSSYSLTNLLTRKNTDYRWIYAPADSNSLPSFSINSGDTVIETNLTYPLQGYQEHLSCLDNSVSTDVLVFEPVHEIFEHSLESHTDDTLFNLVPGRSDIEDVLERSGQSVNHDQDTENPQSPFLVKIEALKNEMKYLKEKHLSEIQALENVQTKEMDSLNQTISILQSQNDHLNKHIKELKESITKKNSKCLEYQDLLHDKTKQMHELSQKDSQAQKALQKEIEKLRGKEKEMGRHINQMEMGLNDQLGQIKEIETRFRVEKQENRKLIKEKNQEIISLNMMLKKQAFSNQTAVDEIQRGFQQQLGDAVENERTVLTEEINKLKESLNIKEQEKSKLQKQYMLERDRFRINMEALKSGNKKLKENIEEYKTKLRELHLENVNHGKVDHNGNDGSMLLRETLTQYEKLLKSLTLDIIEQDTKLCVIIGKNSSRVFSPSGKSSITTILNEAMLSLKDNLDGLRNFVFSLQQENQGFKHDDEQSFDETSASVCSPTSAKLLRHLQARMQQLRKENAQLKEMTSAGNLSTHLYESPEVIKLENKVHELEISLQKYEMGNQKNSHLLFQKNSELSKLQRILTQATKENMRLEKAHAVLQQNISHNDRSSLSVVDEKTKSPTSSETTFHVKASKSPPPETNPHSSTEAHRCYHVKSLGPTYPKTTLTKMTFPKEFISWGSEFTGYLPTDYTAAGVLSQPSWADPDIRYEPNHIKFNEIDGKVNRKSYTGAYAIVNGIPRNPIGRTGMVGRGLLGKWGPNHAADTIVTRWARDTLGKVQVVDGLPILQFISIQRRDSNEWALPGGMIEPGETVSVACKREFSEEALNSLDWNDNDVTSIKERVDNLFRHGKIVYQGYVDDPRNTDNSWMETVAVNFHDDKGDVVGDLSLHHGSDAKSVSWITIDKPLNLYATHFSFIKETCRIHSAYFP